MKIKFIDREIIYSGEQLRSLYNYLEHGVLGNSIIAFHGPCDVSFQFMADGEDLLAGAEIKGSRMAHFIVEIFNENLFSTVSQQRLLACLIQEYVFEKSNIFLKRVGDDLYWNEKKFSISIAAPSTRSSVIHFAVNITNDGTPVPTCSLNDLNISPIIFSKDILERFQKEFISIQEATYKVKSI